MADTQANIDVPETEILNNTELTDELAKLEDEINTLKQVMSKGAVLATLIVFYCIF